jgi:hypothetical protein
MMLIIFLGTTVPASPLITLASTVELEAQTMKAVAGAELKAPLLYSFSVFAMQ